MFRNWRYALCERDVSRVTKHHVVPKSEGGKLTVDLCPACHKTLHSFITNETLAKELSSIEALRNDPNVCAIPGMGTQPKPEALRPVYNGQSDLTLHRSPLRREGLARQLDSPSPLK
jgi:HNH endonuclease